MNKQDKLAQQEVNEELSNITTAHLLIVPTLILFVASLAWAII